MPYGRRRMDYPAGLETEAGCDLGLPGGAAAELAAGFQQFRSRRPVDGAVHASASQEALVGGIDDDIYGELGDIPLDDLDHFFLGLQAHTYSQSTVGSLVSSVMRTRTATSPFSSPAIRARISGERVASARSAPWERLR